MATSLLEPPFSPNNSPISSSSKPPFRPSPNSYFLPLPRSPTATAPICLCAADEIIVPSPPLPADASQEHTVSLERSRDRRKVVRVAWEKLLRWSRSWRSKAKTDVLERTKKVSYFFDYFLYFFLFVLYNSDYLDSHVVECGICFHVSLSLYFDICFFFLNLFFLLNNFWLQP